MQIKFLCICLVSLFLLWSPANSENAVPESTLVETWIYKVSYGPLRLATIKWGTHIEALEDDTLFVGVMEIKSNPKIFFVDVETYYSSYSTRKQGPLIFKSAEVIEKDTLYFQYSFEDSGSVMNVDSWMSGDQEIIRDKVDVEQPTYDLLSFMYSNHYRHVEPSTDLFYSYYNLLHGPVSIEYVDDQKSYEPLDGGEEIDCTFAEGEILFEGISGLSGHFEFWMSDTMNPMIVKAWIKVFLGSVKIRLESIEQNAFEWDPEKLNARLKNRTD